ncbi:vesicular integral-membrane protein VIP36 [Phasianus colchicus]|nr:vesicular integral-membrane protein VIP36 [Phasianus colchicus]
MARDTRRHLVRRYHGNGLPEGGAERVTCPAGGTRRSGADCSSQQASRSRGARREALCCRSRIRTAARWKLRPRWPRPLPSHRRAGVTSFRGGGSAAVRRPVIGREGRRCGVGAARRGGRRKRRMAAGAQLVAVALLLLAGVGPRLAPAELTDGNSEHLKREHSLMKPYQGAGSAAMPLWDFQGSTMVTSQYVRLTPDERSREGSIWNRVPCFLKDWELHVHFKIHGAGKKNLHGDGLALWYTQERLVPGPVFGSRDNFHGLAIFLDTYPNDEATERVFPYISAMVNNGSLTYDHSKDGRWTELAGCTAEIRNQNHDTFLAVRYSRGRLTVMTDVEDKNEWKNCIDIAGVQLPTGYFFGASAGTGDLSDNHDIISMKLFQLMVEHPLEDDTVDWTKIEPSVSLLKSPKDNVDDPTGNFRSGPLTGWKVFLLLLCALLGIIVCAVVGAVVFQKRQERNKRFY